MTITNGYATTVQLKAELNIPSSDTEDDIRVDAAINGASRQIDAFCGRKFWQDGSVVDRQFFADDLYELCGFDISTTTGLVVKIDDDDDGTYETTLTINTDFIVQPVNAADEYPVWPYTSLKILTTGSYLWPLQTSGRPGVQISAKFGWPVVPAVVAQACLIQAKNLFKATSGTFAGYQLASDAGIALRIPGLDFVAAALLDEFRTERVG